MLGNCLIISIKSWKGNKRASWNGGEQVRLEEYVLIAWTAILCKRRPDVLGRMLRQLELGNSISYLATRKLMISKRLYSLN